MSLYCCLRWLASQLYKKLYISYIESYIFLLYKLYISYIEISTPLKIAEKMFTLKYLKKSVLSMRYFLPMVSVLLLRDSQSTGNERGKVIEQNGHFSHHPPTLQYIWTTTSQHGGYHPPLRTEMSETRKEGSLRVHDAFITHQRKPSGLVPPGQSAHSKVSNGQRIWRARVNTGLFSRKEYLSEEG